MNININKYSWDEIKYQTDGWKTCEKNNLTRGRYSSRRFWDSFTQTKIIQR